MLNWDPDSTVIIGYGPCVTFMLLLSAELFASGFFFLLL